MEDDGRRREFWQTLLAMGFQGQAACTGVYSGVELDWRVFERGIFHTRAAELILHFLLGRMDSARVRREFFDCWPIGSPQQAREFRAKAFRWLDDIRRDAAWPADVPVRRSYVDECRGVRFEAVLWALAHAAGRTVLRDAGRPLTEPTAPMLERCRARYARRTRDRLRAVEQWRAAEDALRRQIASADAAREAAHAEYRACRRRLAATCSAEVPDVDAPAAEVGRLLAALVAQAERLWGDCAGWAELNQTTVDAVEAVVERRANGVRLDMRRDVRLAPAPAMADAWAQWLARGGLAPFRGADVSLHAVARMAGACVGALRQSMGSADTGALLLGGAGAAELQLDAARVGQLDSAIEAQGARLARLRRLRAQLADQRARVARHVARPPGGDGAVAAALRLGAGRPVHAGGAVAAEPGRATRLADVWDDLLAGEPPNGSACHALAKTGVPRLSLSFMSDAGAALFPPSRKRSAGAGRPDDAKKRQRLHDDCDVPDFLID
ncbi:hypothetical protein IWW39_002383 [Coemansia spiralis]|uniref:HAUS augmin-like complex subunit 6 N-terminal domain-containing protein n=1 Tax=Coemansia spiralis TaxID=417178 RepID=A0A9W8L3L0_9FUNG|nr:hypothetical protein IWW39_002383 [Coemansia spiralis]